MRVRVRAGMKRYLNPSTNTSTNEGWKFTTVLSQEDGWVPALGNQPSATANTKMSSMPTKKDGREKVVSELVTQKVSDEDPRFLETSIPSSVPMTIAKTVDVPSKRRVFWRYPACIISYATGSPLA